MRLGQDTASVRAFLSVFMFMQVKSWPNQKPKFEVAHKAGSMNVLASQFTADVKLKSDTVNVDVNPGDTQFPSRQFSAPPITHVNQVIHPVVLGKKRSGMPSREQQDRTMNSIAAEESLPLRTLKKLILAQNIDEAV